MTPLPATIAMANVRIEMLEIPETILMIKEGLNGKQEKIKIAEKPLFSNQ